MLARSLNLNFWNFPLWVINILAKVPVIFLLQRKVEFCRNLICIFEYSHCFRFKLWLKFEWCSGLNFE
jgi:hypothetical protein